MLQYLTKVRGGYRILKCINALNKAVGPVTRITNLKDGSRMKLDLRSGTEWPSYYSKSYDDPLVKFLIRVIQETGGEFLDIGANIGFYAVRVALGLSDTQNVRAFEPVGSKASRLRENINLNNLSNVSVYEIALSDHNGSAEIVLREDFQGGSATGNASLAISNAADAGFNKVRIVTQRLDDFVEQQGIGTIGLIKIDVEGHEDLCFAGAAEVLARDFPIVFSEINNWYFNKRGVRSGTALRSSLPREYKAFKIRDFGNHLTFEKVSFDELSDLSGMHNVVFCPDFRMAQMNAAFSTDHSRAAFGAENSILRRTAMFPAKGEN